MGGRIPARDHLGRDYPSMSDMARAWGLAFSTLSNRLDKGWGLREALITPPDPRMSRSRRDTPWARLARMAGGQGAARAFIAGRPPDVVIERLARGWTMEEALAAPATSRGGNLKRRKA